MAKKRPRSAKKKSTKVQLRAKYLLLCDGVGKDAGAGKISVYGIFDTVFAETVPAALGAYNCVAVMQGDGSYDASLVLVDPNGKEVPGPPPFRIECRPDRNAMIQLILAGMVLTRFGLYRFELREGKRVLAAYEFTLKKRTETAKREPIKKK